ncbi:hypothetical protein CDAR_605501 [Caerostris darwini]|uniref:Uncharacterized protein n=1 Tax=Caerostris darwini TaxID=1538125 RepID=A0AAV4RDT0_9ARAC|nr:hypothetical protein CDAR_605501 [Caerostris darwini]
MVITNHSFKATRPLVHRPNSTVWLKMASRSGSSSCDLVVARQLDGLVVSLKCRYHVPKTRLLFQTSAGLFLPFSFLRRLFILENCVARSGDYN